MASPIEAAGRPAQRRRSATSAATGRPRQQRGRVGVLDGPGLRRRLGEHEDDAPRSTSSGDDDAASRRTAARRATPVSVACDELAARRTSSSSGLRKRSGCSTSRSRRVGPGAPVLERALRPWPRLMRVSAVSARARNRRGDEQHDDRRRSRRRRRTSSSTASTAVRATGRGRAAVEAVEQLALARLHGRGLVVGSAWSMPEHVEDAVHDEQRDLVVVGAGVRRARCAAATAGQITTSPSRSGSVVGVGAAAVRAGGRRRRASGRRSTSVVVDREREHVGRAVVRP